MDLQFFAESDVPKQSTTALKRGIRSFEKRIKEHEDYIDNPQDHVPEWDEYDERRQSGLKTHWKKEIRNFTDSIEERKQELRKRGEL